MMVSGPVQGANLIRQNVYCGADTDAFPVERVFVQGLVGRADTPEELQACLTTDVWSPHTRKRATEVHAPDVEATHRSGSLLERSHHVSDAEITSRFH